MKKYLCKPIAIGLLLILCSLNVSGFSSFRNVQEDPNFPFQYNEMARLVLDKGQKVVDAAQGSGMGMALISNGDLYCWGINWYGQLGDGTTTNRSYPVKVLDNVKSIHPGSFTNGAITTNGDLYCWGQNDNGQVGNSNQIDQYTPCKILRNVRNVSFGFAHACAVTEGGELYGWGKNDCGQVGSGGLGNVYIPIKISFDIYNNVGAIKDIRCSGNNSLALSASGKVFSWGYNEDGRAGLKTALNAKTPVWIYDSLADRNITDIELSDNTGAAIADNRSLWLWGLNAYGQMGMGNTNTSMIPLNGLGGISSVYLHNDYTLALSMENILYGCGSNYSHQINSSSEPFISVFTKMLDNVKDVSVSAVFASALTSEGDMYCWGGEAAEPLKALEGVSKIFSGESKCYGITKEGELYSWGHNIYGESPGREAPQISMVKLISTYENNDSDIESITFSDESDKYIEKTISVASTDEGAIKLTGNIQFTPKVDIDGNFLSINKEDISWESSKDFVASIASIEYTDNDVRSVSFSVSIDAVRKGVSEISCKNSNNDILLSSTIKIVDNLSFNNSSAHFNSNCKGYYITSADYNRLLKNLSYVDKNIMMYGDVGFPLGYKPLDSGFFNSLFNIDGKDNIRCLDWNGSCYGMTSLAFLVNSEIYKAKDLGGKASVLHENKATDSLISAINFYHMQQHLTAYQEAKLDFSSMSQVTQLSYLERLAKECEEKKIGEKDFYPILLSYSWYSEFDNEGKGIEKSLAGHIVLGYGYERGNWSSQSDLFSSLRDRFSSEVTFTKRILIYDCSYPEAEDTCFLYYNDNGIWCIPQYVAISTESDNENTVYNKYNNAVLQYVTADPLCVNYVDYNTGDTSLAPSGYFTRNILRIPSSDKFHIKCDKGQADVSGLNILDSTFKDKIFVTVDMDNTKYADASSVFLPMNDSYNISSIDDNPLCCKIIMENRSASVISSKSGAAKFNESGSVSISSEYTSDSAVVLTANEGYQLVQSYPTIIISSKEVDNLCAEISDEGIVVKSGNLGNVYVAGMDYESAALELNVSSDKDSLLITNKDNTLTVLEDSDGDGTFDKVISKVDNNSKLYMKILMAFLVVILVIILFLGIFLAVHPFKK